MYAKELKLFSYSTVSDMVIQGKENNFKFRALCGSM